MQAAPPNAGAVFARSLRLLARSPAIVVPGLVIGTLAAVVGAVLEPGQGLDSSLFTRVLQGCTDLLATILAIAYTTGMADAAWRDGRAKFSDGTRAFRRDAANVFVAMLVLFALGVAATFAAPFTLYLSLLVYMFFVIYTMPAAVVGERSGIVAVGESVQIAFARPVPTLLVVGGILTIVMLLGLVAELLAGAPLVGPIVSQIVVQSVIAYATLVVVGEYRALRGAIGKGAEPSGP